MKKLVVFDLDGTLVDSIFDLGNAVNFALKEYNLPLHPMSDYYTFVGNGMEDLVRRSMNEKGTDDELYKKVRKVFDEHYNAHSNDNTIAYKGVSELLSALRSKSVKTAVLTNKGHRYVGAILDRCFPEHKFDIYYGQRDGIERKPHPQSFELLLEELGVSKEDCLYIGDSEVDVLTAKNAGVPCVCVLWGFRDKADMEAAGGSIYCEKTEDLATIIEETIHGQ